MSETGAGNPATEGAAYTTGANAEAAPTPTQSRERNDER
jgi:hypothetical protein